MDKMREAERRCELRLSDAMEEALMLDADGIPLRSAAGGRLGEDEEVEGAEILEKRVASRARSGFRFQRCGGGRRVIRKSAGRNY